MTVRSLGSASSIPCSLGDVRPQMDDTRGGEAEPNDWKNVWLALSGRLETIARLRAERDAHNDGTQLIFDSHDQARVA